MGVDSYLIWTEKISGLITRKSWKMVEKMEVAERTAVERELNQLMEDTLRLEAELTLVINSRE